MRRRLASVSAICLALALSPLAAPTADAALTAQYSVRNTQEALNMLGYAAGAPDGRMGARTRAAIAAYQRDNGLPVTGEPTAILYDQLLGAVSSGRGRVATTYDQGPSSDLITAVQSELRQRSYSIPVVSGELDPPTREAIIQYQTDAGLTVSGQPSEALLTSLRRADMRRGGIDRRQMVMAIQDELNKRGYDAGPPDGALGPNSRSAIRTYQSDASLPITGEPSESLLASLRNEGGPRFGRSGEPGPRFGRGGEPGPRPPEMEDRGLVRDIQAELRARRLYDGPVNGRINGRTREAIRAYQSAMRLPPNGEPSVDLLASLKISDRAESYPRRYR